MLTASVSGSFHRNLDAIGSAVQELSSIGVRVLSPTDPRPVGSIEDFILTAGDYTQSIKTIQDHHMNCIRSSDFLWLVAPDGYVGTSASMEIGFAAALAIPIFAIVGPKDSTLAQYVRIVPDIRAVVLEILSGPDDASKT